MKQTKKRFGLRLAAALLLCVAVLTHPVTAHAETPLTSDNFDSRAYADTYQDLKNAFGYDHAKLWNHYVKHGHRESRVVYATNGDKGYYEPPLEFDTFDFVRYADQYADLKAAFGYDKGKLWNHYQTYGINEKRKAYATTDQFGIDVSSWQGDINWTAVKNAGVRYAVIRVGYRGSQTGRLNLDNYFHKNMREATAAGIRVGVYFVTQAVNEAEAVEEANWCLAQIGNYGLAMPVFVDVETSHGRGDNIDTATRTAVVKAFCRTITAGGKGAGIYANKNWMTNRIDMKQLTQYTIWLAQYWTEPTWDQTRIDMWQYSSSGKVPGINGRVDSNRIYVAW